MEVVGDDGGDGGERWGEMDGNGRVSKSKTRRCLHQCSFTFVLTLAWGFFLSLFLSLFFFLCYGYPFFL